MAFNPEEGRAEYTASEAQTVFPFAFKIFSNTDIKVYQTLSGQSADDVADILILTTDYTVAINGDLGGTMTLVSGAGVGDSITIVRDLAITRPVEYQTNGDLLADTLNEDQDYQTYLTADRDTAANRHMSIPVSAQNVSTELPPPIPLNFFQWNNDGTAIVNTNTLQADGFIWTASEVYTKTESNDIFVNASGDTMTGQLKGITPISIDDLTRMDYVNNQDLLRVPKTGVQDTEDWDGVAYVDPLAVGANPTALIFPDGSIFGSTDNGIYTRYPNGDLECYGMGGTTVTSTPLEVTFPIVTINPSITLTARATTDKFVNINAAPTGNSVFVNGWFSSGASTTCVFTLEAKGRWK